MIAGFGLGMMLGPSSTDAVNRASRLSYGEATGITQTVRNYAASLGLAVLGTIQVSVFRSHLSSSLVAQGAPTSVADKTAASIAQAGQASGSATKSIPHFVSVDFAHATQVVLYLHVRHHGVRRADRRSRSAPRSAGGPVGAGRVGARERDGARLVSNQPRWATAFVTAKVLAAFLGFSALVTEIATLGAEHRFNSADFFSYFTVEANTLAVISLALGGFAFATDTTSRWLDLFRGAVTLYMTTTILVFIVLLSGYPSKELTAVPWDNTVLHYLMPIVIILDWLIAPPVRTIAFRTAVVWLAYPLAYLFYSLIRGHFTHWYPYPFVDPSHHGYLGVIITSVVIAVILAVIDWIISVTPRWTGRLIRLR